MTHKSLALLIAAGVALHCSVNQASKEKRPVMTQANVRLEVLPGAQRFALGSEVNVAVRLLNDGPGDAWVNGRMLLNTEHAPRAFRELWLDVEGPDHKRRDFTCKVRAGKAQKEHYRVLHSGEERRIEVRLSECFDLDRAGRYVIVAHYQDGNDEVPPAAGAPHLDRAVQSPPVTIEITGA